MGKLEWKPGEFSKNIQGIETSYIYHKSEAEDESSHLAEGDMQGWTAGLFEWYG